MSEEDWDTENWGKAEGGQWDGKFINVSPDGMLCVALPTDWVPEGGAYRLSFNREGEQTWRWVIDGE